MRSVPAGIRPLPVAADENLGHAAATGISGLLSRSSPRSRYDVVDQAHGRTVPNRSAGVKRNRLEWRGLFEGDDLAVRFGLRPQRPIPFRVRWSNKLPVMREKHSAVSVTHFERERSGVLEVRQMVAGEGMAQGIARPSGQAGGCAQLAKHSHEIYRRKGPECFRTGASQARRLGWILIKRRRAVLLFAAVTSIK